jgi:apolipoprotein D and lipocalin family protein
LRNFFVGLCAGLVMFSLAGCASVNQEHANGAPEPKTKVEPGRFYIGTWHEVARRPMALTDGCVAGGTRYSPQTDGTIDVLDFCRQGSASGELRTIGGPGKIMDTATNAKLHVRYSVLGFVPVARDYWILEHASDYSWFISADPTFHDLWIYTRDPHVGHGMLARLVARAKALGYDVSKLEYPAQP